MTKYELEEEKIMLRYYPKLRYFYSECLKSTQLHKRGAGCVKTDTAIELRNLHLCTYQIELILGKIREIVAVLKKS